MTSDTPITEVWISLGGPEPRHGRAAAFWRGGDDLNVALDDAKGCWFDHARGEGGGILDLIELVQGCDRRTAYHWLADRFDLPITTTTTAVERQAWADRRRQAEDAAAGLTQWRSQLLQRLIQIRNAYLDADRTICAWALRNLNNSALALDTDLWDAIYTELHGYGQQALECDAMIDLIETMQPGEMAMIARKIGPFQPDAIEQAVNRRLLEVQTQLEREAAAAKVMR